MEKNILQSRVIDVLRFPMIVGVVLWHSFFEGSVPKYANKNMGDISANFWTIYGKLLENDI